MNNLRSSTEIENQVIHDRYAEYIQQHGEIFEEKTEPLTEEDLLQIKKVKGRANSVLYFASIVLITLAFSYFLSELDTAVLALFAIISVMMVVATGMVVPRLMKINKVLKLNQKRVIQGVITSKLTRKGEREPVCYIEISGKQKFQITPEDYETCIMGEIVRLELLFESIHTGQKVVRVGRV